MQYGTDQTATREDLHRRRRAVETGAWFCLCPFCRTSAVPPAKKRRGRKDRGSK